MNDTDIDTCLPGDVEYHKSVKVSPGHPARTRDAEPLSGSPEFAQSPHRGAVHDTAKRKQGDTAGDNHDSPRKRHQRDARENITRDVYAHRHVDSSSSPDGIDLANTAAEITKNARLQPALALTRMTRMVGAAMETFNKSLEHRHDQGELQLQRVFGIDH